MIRQIFAVATTTLALAAGASFVHADSYVADVDAQIRAQSALALESMDQDNRNALSVASRQQLAGAGFIDAATGQESLSTAMSVQQDEALIAIRSQLAESLAGSVALQVEAPYPAVAAYSQSSSAPGAPDVASPVLETAPAVATPAGKTRIGFRWQSLIPGVMK